MGEIAWYNSNPIKPTEIKPAPPPVEIKPVQSTEIKPDTKPVLDGDTAIKGGGGQASEIPVANSQSTEAKTQKPAIDLDPFMLQLIEGVIEKIVQGDTDADVPVTGGGGTQKGDGTQKPGDPLEGDATKGDKPETKEVEVKSGDTLGKIAKENGVTLDELKQANPDLFKNGKDANGKVRDSGGNKIYPGDKIKIPGKEVQAGGPEPQKPEQKKDDEKKLGHRETIKSVADPHVTTSDGKKLDNDKKGDFVLAQSKKGNLDVQVHNDSIPGDSGVWQTRAAIKTDGNVVKYDAATNSVEINGKQVPFEAGKKIDLPGGGYVEMTKDKLDNGTPFNRLKVHTQEGDNLYMMQFQRANGGKYLDIVGDFSPDRADGEIRGTAGVVDADKDASNDTQLRNGKVTTDTDAFLEDWRVKSGEGIL